MLTAVDLFCGSGGLSAGMIDAGVEVVSAYDNWPAAVRSYRRNIADHVVEFDLADVDAVVREISGCGADIIVGGPPCQDFSTAGKRRKGERANLTVSFALVVSRYNPRFFLMENVPQVRLSGSYETMREILAPDGYRFREFVLDASLCGVPQSRKRFFSFGWRGRTERPGDRFAHWIDEHRADEKLTVKKYLKSEIDVEHYYRHPRNYSRRSVFSVYEPSPTIRGVNRPVPPNYKGNHLDTVPPSSVRPLTTRERSRIQTFPSCWDWDASDRNADTELQIGNAVPVNLAAFVTKGLLHAAAR
ncbi:MAG: DNA (cytosine-5-)-methyltransferase [Gammaproteobacteria bacterium]|nr:DNA (cytosine-5-)-methyltransferase [Gammaproteobacteria bacterium]